MVDNIFAGFRRQIQNKLIFHVQFLGPAAMRISFYSKFLKKIWDLKNRIMMTKRWGKCPKDEIQMFWFYIKANLLALDSGKSISDLSLDKDGIILV